MGQKTAISPMLSVRGGARAVTFYKAAFGAGEVFRIDNDKGEVVARLAVGAAGTSVVWPVAEQYGWRLGRIADPFGHHWEIGKPLG
jgi:PhnB protein